MLIAAIALQRFHLHAGKYPADLKELVPGFLPEVPIDFMNGKPLRYHPNADGTFLLYSVGEDGEDNGGDATPAYPTITHLNWAKGRDAVWPQPATPEQIKAFKEKALADWKKSHGGQTN